MQGSNAIRQYRPRAGFTMVELVFAVTVFMIAIVGAFSSQVTATNLVRTNRETRLAMSDLQAAMEQILSLPLDDIPLAAGPYAPGQAIAAFNNLNLTNEQIVCTYPGIVGAGAGAPPDPLEIDLTLTWTDYRGRPRVLRLSSMRTR